MHPLIISPPEVVEGNSTRYELPPEGISHLGYVVRRMHKTGMLIPVREMVEAGQHSLALIQVIHYAIASAVSFGQLHYEPQRDIVGTTISEQDPETQAVVTATLESITPQPRITYRAQLPNGDCFTGSESNPSGSVDVRGWTMPAPACFHFSMADQSYLVHIRGQIVREIIPRLAGPWHIRAHGQLELEDNCGNKGCVQFERNARASLTINNASQGTCFQKTLELF